MNASLPLCVSAASLILLAGCAPMRSPTAAIDAPTIVKAADWTQTETIELVLDEFGYEPNELRLKAGRPYKLVMRNQGDKDHYYTAPEFYRAIATRKAMVNRQAEVKAPYFEAIEVLKSGQLDLYFVPVSKGTYRVRCTIDDHLEQGMEGTIVIE